MSSFLDNDSAAQSIRISFLFGDPLCSSPTFRAGPRVEIDALDTARERLQLRNALETHKAPVQWSQYPANVKNFLLAFRTSDILHISGHGEDGCLALESEVGELELVSGDRLVSSLSGGEGTDAGQQRDVPSIVFLSVCYGASIVPAFEQLGIPYIITTSNSRILDRAARMFGEQFYLCLLCNKLSVPESFASATARLNMSFTPNLLLRSSQALPPFLDTSARPVESNSPPASASCIGRRREQQELFQVIMQRLDPVIAVIGPRGIGKSEVMLTALSYLLEREHLDCSRVVFVNAKDYKNAEDTVLGLLDRLGIMVHSISSASYSDDQYRMQEAKYELEVLLRHLHGMSQKYMIFAFDNIDAHTDVAAFVDLFNLLRQFSNVTVCYTSRKSLTGAFQERIVNINAIGDDAAINILSGYLRKTRGESAEATREIISLARLAKCLQGNPGAITELANRWAGLQVPLAGSGRPNAGSRRVYIDKVPEVIVDMLEDISEGSIRALISEMYDETLRNSLRTLSEQDMGYLTGSDLWKPDISSTTTNGRSIFLASSTQFLKFFRWLSGLLDCLEASGLWAVQPHFLLRLVNKHEAARLLRDLPVNERRGVFVLGVSESSPSLTITYGNAEGAIVPCLVTFERTAADTRWGTSIGSRSVYFDSLSKLLLGFDSLVSFYPSIRKADVLRGL